MTTINSNTSRTRSGATNATALSSEEVIRTLLNEQTPSTDRRALLSKLGLAQDINTKTPRRKTQLITGTHTSLAEHFMTADIVLGSTTDDKILERLSLLRSNGNVKLDYLLSRGDNKSSILHILLEKSTYVDVDDEEHDQGKLNFDFERIKPFIRFLLRLYPELPMMVNDHGKTPLYATLDDSSGYPHDPETSEKIIHYLCDGNGLRSQKAIESLAHADGKGVDHAIHKAIKTDVRISEQILKTSLDMSRRSGSRSDKSSCFEVADSDGKTVRIFYILLLPCCTTLSAWGT